MTVRDTTCQALYHEPIVHDATFLCELMGDSLAGANWMFTRTPRVRSAIACTPTSGDRDMRQRRRGRCVTWSSVRRSVGCGLACQPSLSVQHSTGKLGRAAGIRSVRAHSSPGSQRRTDISAVGWTVPGFSGGANPTCVDVCMGLPPVHTDPILSIA